MKKLFVVTMYRYGDHEKHSYVLGVFDDHEIANVVGESERAWRCNKYHPEVLEVVLNADMTLDEIYPLNWCAE